MEPWISWPIFLGLGATAYFYYARSGQSRRGRAQGKENILRERQDKRHSTPPGDTTQQVKSSARTESSQGRKRKQIREGAKIPTGSSTLANGVPAVQEPVSETDDQEWAKQLQAAQHGVTMKPSKSSSQTGSAKSTKQRDAGMLHPRGASNNQKQPREETSSVNVIPASQDVSDMLEPAPIGPSTIRITGEEKLKKQAPKKEEPAKETKKQRQNRQKVEERKVLREEDEKERKALEEKQRRTAREARGEPAKNGLSVARPPTSNAWSSTSPNLAGADASQQTPRPAENPLLDTFNQDTHSTTSSNDQQLNTHTPATAASMSSQDPLSEEAQMEAIKEMDGNSGWSEVKKAKRTKKKAPGSPPVEPGTTEGRQTTATTMSEPLNEMTKAPGLPVQTTEPKNDYAPLQPVKNLQPALKAHPDDSDWAVE